MKDRGIQIVAPVLVQTPQVPSYLRIVGKPDAIPIDIATLNPEQLRAIGEAWTDALLARAMERRGGDRYEK